LGTRGPSSNGHRAITAASRCFFIRSHSRDSQAKKEPSRESIKPAAAANPLLANAEHALPFQLMTSTLSELAGLRATVDRVLYMPQLEAPEDRPYPFVYFITIHNNSQASVTIKGRKWVVTDAHGQRVVVEGDGVVGKFPRLEPGQTFSYNSYHVIGSDSRAEGAFFGITDAGEPVFTRIPPFLMESPDKA
jgi:ApaG protein